MKLTASILMGVTAIVLLLSCSPDIDNGEPQKAAAIEGLYTDSVSLYDINLTLPLNTYHSVLSKELVKINDSTFRMCAGTCVQPIFAGMLDSLDIIIRPGNSVRTLFTHFPGIPINNLGSYYDPFIKYFFIKTEFPGGMGTLIIIDRLRKI